MLFSIKHLSASLFLCWVVSISSAAVVELPVLQDSYVSMGAPDTTYGAATQLYASSNSASPSQADRRIYMQFDMSRLHGLDSSKIISARIKMRRTLLNGAEGGGVIGRVLGPWQESSLTWTNRPAVAEEGLTWSSPSGDPGYNTVITVTSLVKSWNSGVSNYGVCMRRYTGSYSAMVFDSKEETTRDLPPVLEVEIGDFAPVISESLFRLNATQDAYVDAADPTANFSTSNQLRVARNNASNREAFIQFDLSSLAGISSSSIVSASLKLHRALISGSNPNGPIGRVTAPWQAGTLTWDTRPALTETDGYEWSAASGDGYNTVVNVTDMVKKWHDGSWANYGLRLRMYSGDYSLMIFDSMEETTRLLPPVIEVKVRSSRTYQVPWMSANGSQAHAIEGDGFVWKLCEVSGRYDEHLRYSSYKPMVRNVNEWKGSYAISRRAADVIRPARISGYYESYVAGQYANRYNGALLAEPLTGGVYSWYGVVSCRVWSWQGPLWLEFVRFDAYDHPTHIHREVIEEGSIFVPISVNLSAIEAIQNIHLQAGEKLAMVVRAEKGGAHVVAEFEQPVGLLRTGGSCSDAASMPGDLDDNCVVDQADLALFLDAWMTCSDPSNSGCNF